MHNIKNMISIQELDSALKYILTPKTWSELKAHFSDIEINELIMILRKLRRDGYIDLLEDGSSLRGWNDEHEYCDNMVIQQNFEGYLFNQEGGYQGKNLKEETQNVRLQNLETLQQDLAKKLNKLTGYIAFGTIALVVVEIIKFFYEILHQSCR